MAKKNKVNWQKVGFQQLNERLFSIYYTVIATLVSFSLLEVFYFTQYTSLIGLCIFVTTCHFDSRSRQHLFARCTDLPGSAAKTQSCLSTGYRISFHAVWLPSAWGQTTHLLCVNATINLKVDKTADGWAVMQWHTGTRDAVVNCFGCPPWHMC